MGLGPWFNAVVIVLLLSVVSETVRAKVWTRWRLWVSSATVFLALGQGYALTVLWQNTTPAILPAEISWVGRLVIVVALATTTMGFVFLAEVADISGLGYGRNPFLFYAITLIPALLSPTIQMFAHGVKAEIPGLLADLAAPTAAALVILGATAGLLAYRRVSSRTAVPLLCSGVVMPPLFASALLFCPVIIANFVSASPTGSASRAFASLVLTNWTSRGPSAIGDALYLLVWLALLVAAAIFVVFTFPYRQGTRRAQKVAQRLSAISGLILVVLIVFIPQTEWLLTTAIGHPAGVNATAMVMFVGLGWPTIVAVTATVAGSTRAPVDPMPAF